MEANPCRSQDCNLQGWASITQWQGSDTPGLGQGRLQLQHVTWAVASCPAWRLPDVYFTLFTVWSAPHPLPYMLAYISMQGERQNFKNMIKTLLRHRTLTSQGRQLHEPRGWYLLDFADFLEDQNLSSKDHRVTDQEARLLVKQCVQLQKLPPTPVLCRLAVAILRLLGNSPEVISD